MEECTSFHDRLFISSSTSNYSNCSSTAARNGFSGSWWESDSSSTAVIRMSDDSCICTSASWIWSFITNSRFNIANSCTLSNIVNWKDISNWNSSFATTENILSRISSFSSKEILSSMFISVRVSKFNFEERGSSSRIMEYRSDNTLNIALSFSEIKISISWRSYSFRFRCSINTTDFTLSLTWINYDVYF